MGNRTGATTGGRWEGNGIHRLILFIPVATHGTAGQMETAGRNFYSGPGLEIQRTSAAGTRERIRHRKRGNDHDDDFPFWLKVLGNSETYSLWIETYAFCRCAARILSREHEGCLPQQVVKHRASCGS